MSKKKLTPMMEQYMEIKKNTEEALVFFRLGDFYELFFEDAKIASRVLDLVLTARGGGEDAIPMCGVPHHAAKSYIQKLVSNGYKVAIVEQVEDPKEAKGLVKREVVEIVTPGTYFEMDDNEAREIASISQDLVYASIVSCNVMSGHLRGIRVMNEDAEIIKHLQQFQVKELVVKENVNPKLIQKIQENTDIYISYHEQQKEGLFHEDPFFNEALQSLLSYLEGTQKSALIHLNELEVLNEQDYLKMDYTSMTNLELIRHDKKQELSVYRFMDHTQTSMGSRLLKEVLMRPLVDVQAIEKRHRQIELFMHNLLLNDQVKLQLKQVYDMHRIIARITSRKHNPQDFVRLKQSLLVFHTLQEMMSPYDDFEFMNISPLYDVFAKLDEAFRDDAPVQFKEGKTFKEGIDAELDELVSLSDHGDIWLLDYEKKEREKTGIKNLRVGYTRAFGYYIEISKGQVENVKDEYGYVRKQTLTNSERYISSELQEFEMKINEAKDRILYLEQKLFEQYTDYIIGYAKPLHKVAQALSYLDVLLSISEFSNKPGYIKPQIHTGKELLIKEGRHPVLEASLEDKQYISSDVHFDENRQILVLTGPNMGGKSTYMRMIAVNVILAQMGAYIPAEYASIGIVDQIFTRMGASDDILMGQSTFMVEMLESQLALSRASDRSLILFDEIGRGTSTYDGMAIAQAIIEYIHEKLQSRTIFSTHYHELVALEDLYDRIFNIHAQVHEDENKITFLYKVAAGRSTKSYGINVARLAQLPQVVIERAEENLEILEMNREEKNISRGFVLKEVVPEELQNLKRTIQEMDINSMTPIEALLFLTDIKKKMEADE